MLKMNISMERLTPLILIMFLLFPCFLLLFLFPSSLFPSFLSLFLHSPLPSFPPFISLFFNYSLLPFLLLSCFSPFPTSYSSFYSISSFLFVSFCGFLLIHFASLFNFPPMLFSASPLLLLFDCIFFIDWFSLFFVFPLHLPSSSVLCISK